MKVLQLFCIFCTWVKTSIIFMKQQVTEAKSHPKLSIPPHPKVSSMTPSDPPGHLWAWASPGTTFTLLTLFILATAMAARVPKCCRAHSQNCPIPSRSFKEAVMRWEVVWSRLGAEMEPKWSRFRRHHRSALERHISRTFPPSREGEVWYPLSPYTDPQTP